MCDSLSISLYLHSASILYLGLELEVTAEVKSDLQTQSFLHIRINFALIIWLPASITCCFLGLHTFSWLKKKKKKFKQEGNNHYNKS